MLHFNNFIVGFLPYVAKNLFYPLFLLFCLCYFPGYGQAQLGMRLERFAGIQSAALNPANTRFNPCSWDLRLAGADVFFQNNYGFVRNAGVIQLLRTPEALVSVLDTTKGGQLPPDALVQDFFGSRQSFFGVFQAQISGIAFSFRVGAHHTVGVVSGIRAGGGAYRLPEILNYPVVSNLPRGEVNVIPKLRVAGMVWSEAGLHYSYSNDEGDYLLAFGVTPKLLWGYEGFFVRANTAFDYTQRRGDTLAFARARWEYGLTTDQLTAEPSAIRPQVNGHGFGVDLGFSIAAPLETGLTDYFWRLGVALLDAGQVRFKQNAVKHLIEFDQTVVVVPSDFPNRTNLDQMMKDASKAFLGDTLASLQGPAFSIGLPTALSFQADLRLMQGVYLGAVWIQRMPLMGNSVRRPNTVALIPRFEHTWFSASMPISWSDGQFLRAGFAARLGYLTLGTDNLLSFTGQAKLTGTDFYIGLKINGFKVKWSKLGIKLPKYTKKSRYGPNVWQRMRIKCYDF